ncbi:MAG: NADH-quinone oxidoreductase subunit NuoH [Chloroflexi bacterium]|nr:NADH-quinone oxidoreductase subunit NuoH [Chloroflexota bacterium]
MDNLPVGCQAPGHWDGMSFWREWIINFFPRTGDSMCHGMRSAGFADWGILIVMGIIGSLIIVNVAALAVPFVVLLERKLLGRFQHRIGPNRVGIFGSLQPLADAIKLMTKEDTTPRAADRLVFMLAPLAFAIPVLLMYAPLPWAQNTVLADLDTGILFVIAVGSAAEVGVFMAGWSSNNKYSLFGAMRAVAMVVSYEIPLILSVVGVILLAGSLKLSDIIANQHPIPNILWQPLGFLVFLIAVTAELNRAPFDLLEADSEIVAGFHTEYSGMKWAMVQLGEYAALIGFSGIISTLFLAGWKGPFWLPGYIWLVLKIMMFLTLFIWVRATLPRLRIDQIMGFGWKFLLPLSIVNIFVTAAEVVAYPDGLPKWLIAVNFAVAAACIVGLIRLMGFDGRTRDVAAQGREIYAHTGTHGGAVQVVGRGG